MEATAAETAVEVALMVAVKLARLAARSLARAAEGMAVQLACHRWIGCRRCGANGPQRTIMCRATARKGGVKSKLGRRSDVLISSVLVPHLSVKRFQAVSVSIKFSPAVPRPPRLLYSGSHPGCVASPCRELAQLRACCLGTRSPTAGVGHGVRAASSAVRCVVRWKHPS